VGKSARPQIKLRANRRKSVKTDWKADERVSTHFNGFGYISPQFICGWVLAEVPFVYTQQTFGKGV